MAEKNYWKLVDNYVAKKKASDEKYGDSVAIGALSATLYGALYIMDDVISAFEHEDHEEAMMHLRYAVKDCKQFIKTIEEAK